MRDGTKRWAWVWLEILTGNLGRSIDDPNLLNDNGFVPCYDCNAWPQQVRVIPQASTCVASEIEGQLLGPIVISNSIISRVHATEGRK